MEVFFVTNKRDFFSDESNLYSDSYRFFSCSFGLNQKNQKFNPQQSFHRTIPPHPRCCGSPPPFHNNNSGSLNVPAEKCPMDARLPRNEVWPRDVPSGHLVGRQGFQPLEKDG